MMVRKTRRGNPRCRGCGLIIHKDAKMRGVIGRPGAWHERCADEAEAAKPTTPLWTCGVCGKSSRVRHLWGAGPSRSRLLLRRHLRRLHPDRYVERHAVPETAQGHLEVPAPPT